MRSTRTGTDRTLLELPFIDQRTVTIAASRDVVWRALERYVAAFLRRAERGFLTTLLGTEPRSGFEVAERIPADRLVLTGRHRFSRYHLTFDLSDAAHGATQLRATTPAEFPGIRGRAYRALVLGTRLHVVATNRILRSIRRRALTTLVGIPLAVCALLGLGAHSASAEVPKWIAPEPSDPSGRPLWVSVEVALTTDNSLRSELFSREFAAAIDRLNQQAEERRRAAQSVGHELAAGSAAVAPYDCDQSGPSRGQEPGELYANSRLILAGKVTHRRQGFFRETVGRLLEVAVDETIKAPAGAQSHRSLLLFLQEALVSPGLRRFCIDGASRRPPAIGARVLLLGARPLRFPTTLTVPFAGGTDDPERLAQSEPSQEALLATYAEVCRSYHAIDDFRMKLLGLLPLASLIGLILLDSGQVLPNEPTPLSREIIGSQGSSLPL